MRYSHETKGKVMLLNIEQNLIETNFDAELADLLDRQIEQGILLCAVNLKKVQFVNSSGIATLMRILAKFRNAEGEVVLFNISDNLHKLLIMTKLSAIFHVSDSEEEAIRILNLV